MELTGNIPDFPDLQDLEMPNNFKVKALKELMTKEAIVTMFISHRWYLCDARSLAREDTLSLMRRYWYNDNYAMSPDLFDTFENDDAALTRALNLLPDDKKQAVIAHVDRLFTRLRNEDPEVDARARILSGFPGRLPRLDIRFKDEEALKFRRKQLEPHQYLFHYAAVNWGTDRQNKALNEEQITGLLLFHYKFDSRITDTVILHCSKVLANPNHSTTKKVAAVAEMYKAFFKDKVSKEFEDYEKSKSQGSSSRFMSDLPSISGVTRAMADSSLHAMAPNLNQSTAGEPRVTFRENMESGKGRQELAEQAARGQEDTSEKGKSEGKRKKESTPPEKKDKRPRHPPPPPPPSAAAGPSRTSLPYDPTRN